MSIKGNIELTLNEAVKIEAILKLNLQNNIELLKTMTDAKITNAVTEIIKEEIASYNNIIQKLQTIK